MNYIHKTLKNTQHGGPWAENFTSRGTRVILKLAKSRSNKREKE